VRLSHPLFSGPGDQKMRSEANPRSLVFTIGFSAGVVGGRQEVGGQTA
jgi:hypothetical protein